MVKVLLRRLRGIVLTVLFGAVPLALVGFVTGLVLSRTGVQVGEALGPQDLPLLLAILGAVIGGASGFVLALLIIVGERGRTVETLRATRVGLWGVLAGGAAQLIVWRRPSVGTLLCALATGVVTWGAVRLAQRARPAPAGAADAPRAPT